MDSTTIALVTGANKGIGKEVARQLGAQGATVWLGARDEARGRAAEAELRSTGDDVRYVQLDVTDTATVAAAAKLVETEHGRLDVLVNNAGVFGPPPTFAPSEVPLDAVRELYETNVVGVVAVTNAVLPLLRRSRAGRIVNVSSMLGSLAQTASPVDPFALLAAYNSSKTAVNMATLMWARELRDTPIKVNAVCPGFCATEMNGFRGPLSPAEGASVLVQAATLPDDGPTGTFFGAEGPIPW